jgi:adenylate cyclase
MLGAEDIGEQHVKNMPRPVHAYRLTVAGPRPGAAAHPAHAMARSMPRTRLLLAGGATTVLVLAALAGTFHVRHPSAPRSLQTARTYVRPAGCACARAGYRRAPVPSPRHSLGRICAPAVPRAAPQPPPAPRRFAARDVPFVPDFHWRALQNYADAPGAKALALNVLGIFATATDRLDEAAARRTTVEDCNRKVERHVPVVHAYDGCTLYAVENDVVWSFRSPPMPPPPCAFNEAVAAGHPGSCDGAVATPGSARAVDRPLPHQPTQSRAYTRTQSLRLVDTERRRRRRDPPQPADLQPSYGTALRRVRTE